jgi:hypothetical protein
MLLGMLVAISAYWRIVIEVKRCHNGITFAAAQALIKKEEKHHG